MAGCVTCFAHSLKRNAVASSTTSQAVPHPRLTVTHRFLGLCPSDSLHMHFLAHARGCQGGEPAQYAAPGVPPDAARPAGGPQARLGVAAVCKLVLPHVSEGLLECCSICKSLQPCQRPTVGAKVGDLFPSFFRERMVISASGPFDGVEQRISLQHHFFTLLA